MGILSASYATIVVAEEATYAVDAVDALYKADGDVKFFAANSGAEITPVADNYVPDRVRGSQAGVASSFVPRQSDWTLPIPVLGNEDTNRTPDYSPILKCCGFQEDIGSGETTYTLGTINDASATVYIYRRDLNVNQWRLKDATGCVGNLSLAGTPGEEIVATAAGSSVDYAENSASLAYFDATTGYPLLDSDGATITPAFAGTVEAPDTDPSQRLICKSATISYNSGDLKVAGWSLDYALGVGPITTQTGDTLACRIVRGRDGASNASGELTLVLCDDGVGYDDVLAAIEANEVATMTIVLANATTQVTITNLVQFQARPSESAEGSAMNFTAPFIVVGDTETTSPFGDTSSTIKFEALP